MRGRGKPNHPGKYPPHNNKLPPQQSMAPFQSPTCLRLLVSEATARAIVGVVIMGGYELERIRNQMDGALNVDGDAGLAATVTFQSVKEHLMWAFGEVVPHLSLAPPPYVPHIPIKSDVIVNVLMPEHICGYFIGKAGVVIKKLSKVESDVLPESNEKVLIVAGSYQKIDAMMEYIIDFYCQKLDMNSVRYYFTNYANLLQNGTLMSVQNTSFAQITQTPHHPLGYNNPSSNYEPAPPVSASNMTSQNTSMNHNFMMTGYMGGSAITPLITGSIGGAVNNTSNPAAAAAVGAAATATAALIQPQTTNNNTNNNSTLNSCTTKAEYNPYS